jgi:hypothetical protein
MDVKGIGFGEVDWTRVAEDALKWWAVCGHNTVRSENRYALIKGVGVMSTSVCTGLNPFNFIRKHFLQICVRKVALHL